ncbi:ROK family protein [Tessaracoccus caeni]|uniref:ROK family protein n=1 Tax=Tessaracoccus caeni TaxID=3031239 RepID=UPI003873631A
MTGVFEALRRAPATVRSLVAETGLSRPTVMSLLDKLEKKGLASSNDAEAVTAGRPASTWRIAGGAGVVVVVDLLPESAVVASARLDGTVIAAELVDVVPVEGRRRLAALIGLIRAHQENLPSDAGPVRAVAISTTGPVDGAGTIINSVAVTDWSGFPLGQVLSERLGLPVRVENDINSAAYGEFSVRHSAGTLGDSADLLFVALSRGVLSGLVLRGELHRGQGFTAGEVGIVVTGGSGPEHGHLSRAAEVIASAAAVLDPSVIVLSLPMTELPDAIAEINGYLASTRTPGATPLIFEGPLLGQSAATVGALALALKDAQERLLGQPASTVFAPSGLEPVRAATSKGKHLPMHRYQSEKTATLKVGVVGVGSRSVIARHFEEPDLGGRIVAAYEPHPDAEARIVSRLGRDDILAASSVAELVASGIDVALVTAPDNAHAELACQLLEAGVPVYLEKPIAIELEGATRILTTAYETGTKLYVGHNMRHMNVVRGMRDIIRRGLIGEVKAIWCRHFVGHGGDYYFKDWHATREGVGGLLLQKAAHDLDVMHWLADSHTQRVSAMGALTVYDKVDDRRDRSNELMGDWFSFDNWPPLAQRGLNPVIDVEDLSMMLMRMESGVLASYEQCHYTPDYWRNYTVIGTEGRIENFGDSEGGVIKLWNRRRDYDPQGDAQFPIEGDAGGHGDADRLTIGEFVRFIRDGAPTDTSPLGAWYAVAAAIQATESLRADSAPRDIPELPQELVEYFTNNQTRPAADVQP